ncbi:cytochrome c oxidase assembly protein [Pseudonocardia spinosispora]|uniref:cytochrome c oxidase assembly protein n=1 Tax=Pseudonocardia spinosispora TaxID=103441 RepID=UPI000A011F81|nr:cytochrome c oxidase assembly protein [Pseudonocardia spinosispora]
MVGTTTSVTDRTGRSGLVPLVLLGGVLAAFVAGGLTALSGSRPLEALGLPDPGTLTTFGLPIVRTVSEIAAVLTVGALLLAAFLAAPQRSGYLDVTGYRALRSASYAAGTWTVAALLMVPLTVADTLGRPVTDVLGFGRLVALVPRLEVAGAWTVTAVLAVVVFAGARVALSWGTSVVLLGIAVFGLLPVASTGHSAAGGSHDVATDSLMLHVVAAALWVGGLVAVLGLAGRKAEAETQLPTVIRRYSALALVCWIVMAVSGVLNALVRIPLSDLFGTYYGALLLAKTCALLVLGGFGYLQRRHAVDSAARGRRGALLRLGAVEVLIMLGTVGLAVALGRSAPPLVGVAPPSRTEVVIGYDLSGPPTLSRILFDWRFDLLFGTAALVAAALYLLAVRRLARRGDGWPVGRTVSWIAGCAVVLIATSSGIGRYSPAMFSMHMAEHMMLAMLAPILLVLAAPVTLALRALPVSGKDAPPGPREWLLAAVHSTPARWLTHPLVTLPLFVGTYYLLYFSGLFEAALPSHPAHLLMIVHFMATGALFFWPLIGVDPAPRPLAPVVRLGLVFASVPFHAFFGVILMSTKTVIGGSFYGGLALPWVPDLLADQRLGGGLAWATGEVPLIIVVVALVVQWSRLDERFARQSDRRAELDGDADRAAYNAMLREMAGGSRSNSDDAGTESEDRAESSDLPSASGPSAPHAGK